MIGTIKLTYTELQILIDIIEVKLSQVTQLTPLKVFDGGTSLGYDGKRGEFQTILHKLEDMQIVGRGGE